MPDLILHKRSLTPNSTPTTASLSIGELAINVNDGKVFVRRSGSLGDSIVPIVTTGITNSGSIIGNFTGSLFGTASFSSLAATASYYNTGSLLITSSVSNATITFTKGNGSTYPLTINNVTNAQTASVLSGFNQSDYLTTSSFNIFTASYNTGSFSGSFIGTASFAINAATASFYNTSSLIITSSVSNATITFTKGDGSTYPITINNVVNAQTASYVLNAISSSYASNADLLDGRDSTSFAGLTSNTFVGNQIISGNVDITGIVTANELHITYTTSSVIFTSGSTKFGNSSDDTHQFTGSILAGIISGTNATFNTFTGSLFGTSSFASLAATASYYNTSSLLVTSSVSNATITFVKGDNSSYPLTINNVVNAQTASVLSGFNQNDYLLTSSFNNFTASYNTGSFSGSFTGSLFGTASYATLAATASFYNTSSLLITASVSNDTITITKGNYTTFPLTINNVINAATASYVLNAVSASYASNADLFDGRDSTTFAGTGSNIFNGNQVVTGTIVATSNISGATGLFTTITSSQSLVSNVMSVGNYIQLLPVANTILPTNQTASYIYTSGSTNDLYFTQYQPVTNNINTTRLRWLEGGLSTGLLHGGLLSTVTGTTTFSLTSGSGIILTYNATIDSDPYPTIKFVSWNNFVSQSLIYSASAQITYIAIDENGVISQTNVAFTPAQFKDRIVIGRVLHQTGSVTNGTITTPTTAYGVSSNVQDFFRAFGPLKVNGQVLAASGSTLAITRTAGDSYVEGRNYSSNPNVPNYILAVDDPALTTTKIFYSWVSGSSVNIDTNGGAGYSALIPNRYNLNGIATTITPTNNKFTIQRVYWFPKSVTRSLYVYYGSTIYTTLAEAVAAVANEPNFTEGDNTKASAVYLGAVVMEANTSDLTITTKAQIINAGLFRGSGGGAASGGGGTTSPGGATHEIQYNDSGVFNGSPNLTFDTTTLTLTGDFVMNGTGSINIDGGFITGSLAQFTTISGSIVTGSTALFTQITGNLFGTSSYATNAATASYYNTSSLLITASVSNATITFTKGDNTTFPLVINNVVNSQTASYILNAVSSSYASNADLLDNRDSTTFAGTGSNTFNGNQIITGTLNVSSTFSGTTALLTTITSSQIVIGSALYASKTITSVVGNNIIYNVPTALYDGMFVDYTARSGSNARAGNIMAIWSGSFVNYTETTTNDFGSTTDVLMGVVIDGANLQLSASTTSEGWLIKTIVRTI